MPMEQKRITISATFTAEPIEETLRFWLRELQLAFEIEFAPYNQVFQELLDPDSLLSRNLGGINVVLARFEDFRINHNGGKSAYHLRTVSDKRVEDNVRDLARALKSAAALNSATYLVGICPFSDTLIADPDTASNFWRIERDFAAELRN